MAHYQIRHEPDLTLEKLGDRFGRHLSPPLETDFVRPAPWLAPRLLIHGGGAAAAAIRLRQGPTATVLSIDRLLVNKPGWARFVPRIFRFVFVGDDKGANAQVRSILLESGEFAGPDGDKPRRLFRPGTVWMLGDPRAFKTMGLLKLVVGLVMACIGLHVCTQFSRNKDGLEPVVLLAGLGARWIYTGIANLRGRWPSFGLTLAPLAVTIVAAIGISYAAAPIRAHFANSAQDADLQDERQKVLAGGPVREYVGHVEYALGESKKANAPERNAQLSAQLAEAVQIMVKRNVFLRDTARILDRKQLPGVDEARKTTDQRLQKLRTLIDRQADPAARALEAKVRGRKYVLDESGTPGDYFGKYTVSVAPPNDAAERELTDYLRQHHIRAGIDFQGRSDASTTINVANDADPAQVKALLAATDPAAGDDIPFAELDRKETVLRTDDPESFDIIVPAQYARSAATSLHEEFDLKWDEALYRQGKVIMQIPLLDKFGSDSFRTELGKWEPQAGVTESQYKPWP